MKWSCKGALVDAEECNTKQLKARGKVQTSKNLSIR